MLHVKDTINFLQQNTNLKLVACEPEAQFGTLMLRECSGKSFGKIRTEISKIQNLLDERFLSVRAWDDITKDATYLYVTKR